MTKKNSPQPNPQKPAGDKKPSEKKSGPAASVKKSAPAPVGGKKKKKQEKKKESMRETVEAVAVAFILAFLFRTFEAEAFVIPTGSMAPTLMGRHKDVCCEQCGFCFRVGASEEVDPKAGLPRGAFTRWFSSGLLRARILTTRCPNCRFENDIRNTPVFKGDRILVNKQLAEPKRFEVIVFKYPEEPQVNYIKRLVGLPGETIHIQSGDLFARREPTEEWKVLRKDNPNKQQAIQIPVYDDNYPALALLDAGWPERWAPMSQANAADSIAGWSVDRNNGWSAEPESRAYSYSSGGGNEMNWLRYQHLPASQGIWEAVANGQPIDANEIRPRLIADFCSYNTYVSDSFHAGPTDYGTYWVGDLTLESTVELTGTSEGSKLVLELVEGKRWFRCHINPATGAVRLTVVNRVVDPENEAEEILAEGECPIDGDGTWDLRFANVDDRLCLWVNDDLVEFGPGNAYTVGRANAPQQRDLIPIGIGTSGVNARVSNLKIYRDIYYRAETMAQFAHVNELDSDTPMTERELSERLDSPEAWYEYYSNRQNMRLTEDASHQATFELGPDEFLVLGDNSPRSKDSRLFGFDNRARRLMLGKFRRYAVPRSALIGKAFFVYWPHGVPFLNGGEGFPVSYHETTDGDETEYPDARAPFYPDVTRMRRIR